MHSAVAKKEPFLPGKKPIVSAASVRATFMDRGITVAVDGLDLEVFRGEIFGLFGPGGCGKSTTLRLLAGLHRPVEGKIRVFGKRVGRRVKSRLAYVSQAGLPQKNGFAQVRESLKRMLLHSSRPTPQGYDANGRMNELKLALLKKPELFLLDEPFQGLNANEVARMRELILDLSREGKTIILSGSSLQMGADLCGRLALYCRGRIEATGSLEELLESPENIRLISPLISAGTSQLILDILRLDLTGERVGSPPPVPGTTGNSVPEQTPPVIGAKADSETPSTSIKETKNTIDHAKLAELTKPQGGRSPEAAVPGPASPGRRSESGVIPADTKSLSGV